MSRVSFWMQCIKEPNEETLTAMKEAKENGNLETLDLDNFEKYVDSLK